jgi:hypothetical protein
MDESLRQQKDKITQQLHEVNKKGIRNTNKHKRKMNTHETTTNNNEPIHQLIQNLTKEGKTDKAFSTQEMFKTCVQTIESLPNTPTNLEKWQMLTQNEEYQNKIHEIKTQLKK